MSFYRSDSLLYSSTYCCLRGVADLYPVMLLCAPCVNMYDGKSERCIYVYIYVHNCMYTYVYIYIYAQRLGFAQALQRRGSPFPNKC